MKLLPITNALPVLSVLRAAVVSLGMVAGLAIQPVLAQEEPKIPVATVNGEEIFLDEVMALTDRLPAEMRQQPLDTYFDRLVDDIIDSRLAAAAGNEAGLTEDPDILRRMSIAAQRVLAEAWISREIRNRVTEDELKSAYEIYVADTGSREEVKARHILVAEKQTAEEIIKQLDEGGDFVALAKEKSTGPSGPNGGDLGYFGRGAMVPTFETAAFALEAGQYSKTPVQTQFGWHIILLEDKRTAAPPSFDELAPQLRQNLISQNLARLLDGLRQDAAVSRRNFADIRTDAQAAAQGGSQGN